MTDPWGNPLPEGVELHAPPAAPAPAPPAPAAPAQSPPPPPANPAWPGSQPAAPMASGWTSPLPQAQWGQPAPGPRTSGMAIAAMVCGIVGILCFGIVLGPVALGLGIAARRSIDASGGSQKGAGMAIAGIVLGIIATAFAILGAILLVRNPDLLDNLFTTTTTGGGLQGA